MWNEPWVWPEVGDARMSGAGTVPLRSAQMMGQQKKKKKKERNKASQVLLSEKEEREQLKMTLGRFW